MFTFSKLVKIFFFTTLLATLTYASNGMQDYRAVHKHEATILQDGKNKEFCSICGMTLQNFYKTNHSAVHSGKTHQYCSIICMVEDSVVNNKKLSDIKVVDNTTLQFIDANKAFYIVGSEKPGTMSPVSIYAFGTKEAAVKFSKEFGGDLKTFDEVYQSVLKSQAKDMAATKQRQAKAAKKGAMMYKKMCQKTDKRFISVADAKSYLIESKICGNIEGKKLQAIALFLSNR